MVGIEIAVLTWAGCCIIGGSVIKSYLQKRKENNIPTLKMEEFLGTPFPKKNTPSHKKPSKKDLPPAACTRSKTRQNKPSPVPIPVERPVPSAPPADEDPCPTSV